MYDGDSSEKSNDNQILIEKFCWFGVGLCVGSAIALLVATARFSEMAGDYQFMGNECRLEAYPVVGDNKPSAVFRHCYHIEPSLPKIIITHQEPHHVSHP